MAYLALYRKFRPSAFSEVKGQDHVVTTLKNQIRTDHIGHAYLFTGTRGTGKTSVAKLFAKAVNCSNPAEDGSPCGECESCKSIQGGSSMNVFELDAASNNGVDNVRDIIENMEYPPTEGKYKVYIIDEVHMLSTGAFNALLKSLEEPPEYVIFILATTEVHKIPVTILSRCQRYDFHRISVETITERMEELMAAEGISVEDKALRYIAKAADGAMRDALSLLDQCIAFYLGETITYEKVLQVLGAVDTEIFSRLLRAVCSHDVNAALMVLDEVLIEGRELSQFVTDFIWYLRNLLLLKSGSDVTELLDISQENKEALMEEVDMVNDQVLMRYIRVLSQLLNQLKGTSQKRVLVEVALIKLCRPQMEEDYGSLIDRIGDLEMRLATGAFAAPQGLAPQGAALAGGTGTETSASAGRGAPVRHKLPEALPEDLIRVRDNWKKILEDVGLMNRRMLEKATVTVSDAGDLLICLDDALAYDRYQNTEGAHEKLEESISNAVGSSVHVKFELNNSGVPSEKLHESLVEKFFQEKNIPMEIATDLDEE